jgi:hypothetical protein
LGPDSRCPLIQRDFSPLWHPGCSLETNCERVGTDECGVCVTGIRHNCEITLNMRPFALTFSRFHRQTDI